MEKEDLSDYICKVAYKKDQATIVCKTTITGEIITSHMGPPPLIRVIEDYVRGRGGKIINMTENPRK